MNRVATAVVLVAVLAGSTGCQQITVVPGSIDPEIVGEEPGQDAEADSPETTEAETTEAETTDLPSWPGECVGFADDLRPAIDFGYELYEETRPFGLSGSAGLPGGTSSQDLGESLFCSIGPPQSGQISVFRLQVATEDQWGVVRDELREQGFRDVTVLGRPALYVEYAVSSALGYVHIFDSPLGPFEEGSGLEPEEVEQRLVEAEVAAGDEFVPLLGDYMQPLFEVYILGNEGWLWYLPELGAASLNEGDLMLTLLRYLD